MILEIPSPPPHHLDICHLSAAEIPYLAIHRFHSPDVSHPPIQTPYPQTLTQDRSSEVTSTSSCRLCLNALISDNEPTYMRRSRSRSHNHRHSRSHSYNHNHCHNHNPNIQTSTPLNPIPTSQHRNQPNTTQPNTTQPNLKHKPANKMPNPYTSHPHPHQTSQANPMRKSN